eukprot:c9806_g1_i1.p1 GENE.c9806_g1_i1~~c9806_g1_i1.p1  ORF type:complete len:752 (+),score=119.28 c9806_g1_i1:32-2257(+)
MTSLCSYCASPLQDGLVCSVCSWDNEQPWQQKRPIGSVCEGVQAHSWTCASCNTTNDMTLPYCELCELAFVDSEVSHVRRASQVPQPAPKDRSHSILENKLELFYAIFNPEKLDTVPELARKYEGRVGVLNAQLFKIYGTDLSAADAPTVNMLVCDDDDDDDEDRPERSRSHSPDAPGQRLQRSFSPTPSHLHSLTTTPPGPRASTTSELTSSSPPLRSSHDDENLHKVSVLTLAPPLPASGPPPALIHRSISAGTNARASTVSTASTISTISTTPVPRRSPALPMIPPSKPPARQTLQLPGASPDAADALLEPSPSGVPGDVSEAFNALQPRPLANARRMQYAVSMRNNVQVKVNPQYMEHAPMVVIPFSKLVCLKKFPEREKRGALTVPYTSLTRSRSLVVYISHSPIGHREKMDFKGNPKLNLIIKSIQCWLETWAKGLEVYLWMMPLCAPSSSHMQSALSYMERCDCALIPIVDVAHDRWEFTRSHQGVFVDYMAHAFQEHLKTAWGRLDLIAATRVTRLADTFDVFVLMGQGPNFRGCRPMFVYGSKEALAGAPPLLLPEVRPVDVQTYLPTRGRPSFKGKRDLEVVSAMFRRLSTVFQDQQASGYKGPTDGEGYPHGHGVRTFENGDRYNGEWVHGREHGFGVYLYQDGSKYEGEWRDGKRHGKGVFVFWSGNVEESEYVSDLQHGKASFKRIDGCVSTGQYSQGKRVGVWVRLDPEGNEAMRSRYEDGVQLGRD